MPVNGLPALDSSRDDPRALVGEVERLLGEAESLPDPVARATTTGLVQAMFALYEAGLERIVDELAAVDVDGQIAAALSEDELVSHLLLLHGLHPVSTEERVLGALDEVRPYLESHGGNVELLGVEGERVTLRLQGSCSGCPSSTMTLKLAIENAIHKAAPEIADVVAEAAGSGSGSESGSESGSGSAGGGLLQIEVRPGTGGAPAGAPPESTPWSMAGGLPELAGGRSALKPIEGRPVLFLEVAGQRYAYLPECPACDATLGAGDVDGIELTCPGCGNRYDALRAGRCLDTPSLHLEPVPLLVGEDGLAKVALPVGA